MKQMCFLFAENTNFLSFILTDKIKLSFILTDKTAQTLLGILRN